MILLPKIKTNRDVSRFTEKMKITLSLVLLGHHKALAFGRI